jgi:hypothetical protein
MESLKEVVKKTPLVGPVAKSLLILFKKGSFPGSQKYWESRYTSGGTSGAGSYGKLAEFKAEVLNAFVREHQLHSILEFGCGDGHQLSLSKFPAYIGLDVAKTAIQFCKERFQDDATKSFFLYDPDSFLDRHSVFRSQLVISLDVIYHLTEDRIFELYMRHVFSAAERFVIIYSSDMEMNPFLQMPHVRHRRFSAWVESHLPEWKMLRKVPNKYPFTGDNQTGSYADFFIYQRI